MEVNVGFEGLAVVDRLVDGEGRDEFVTAHNVEMVERQRKYEENQATAQALRPSARDAAAVPEVEFPSPPFWGVKVLDIPVDEVVECNRIATGGVTPDATVLLDVDAEVGAGRQRAAGKSADRMEREDAAFHRTVAAAYREHAARVAGILRVDADGTPEQVHRRVREALAARFPETFAAAGFISR
mgnify:CR=1 FL=1